MVFNFPATKYCQFGLCHYYDDILLQSKRLFFQEVLGSLDLGHQFGLGLRWIKAISRQQECSTNLEDIFLGIVNDSLNVDVVNVVKGLDSQELLSPVNLDLAMKLMR